MSTVFKAEVGFQEEEASEQINELGSQADLLDKAATTAWLSDWKLDA